MPIWLTATLAVVATVGPLVGVWLGHLFSTWSQREQRKEEARIRKENAIKDEKDRQRSAIADFLTEIQNAENEFHQLASAETRWATEKNTEFILAGKPELCGSHGESHKSALQNLCLRWINRAVSAWGIMDIQLTDPELRHASGQLSNIGEVILSEFHRTYKVDPEKGPDYFDNSANLVYYSNLRIFRNTASQRLSHSELTSS